MTEKLTMIRLAKQVPDEAAAWEYLEHLRWGGSPRCCHCDSENVVYLVPANGTTRATRTGAMSARRVWKCRNCKRQFSATTGTIMHRSKVAIRVWLFVVFEMVSAKNGISAREVERRYGVCPRTAWHLLHRVREAMDNGGLMEPMRGTILADETFIGGLEGNKHRQGRHLSNPDRPPYRKPVEKVAVLSVLDKATGEVRSRVVNDVTAASLRKAIAEQVDMAGSILHTDGWRGYRTVGQEFITHESVDHSHYEYVRGDVTTNHIEGFFSQLKRSLDGTHHHVSRKHLSRYLGEFDFRHTTRGMTDTARMYLFMTQVEGIRLAYRPMVAARA